MDTSAIISAFLALCAVCSCSSARKVAALREGGATFSLSLPERLGTAGFRDESVPAAAHDTLLVTDKSGREMIIMKAVRDENGEMVATDVIDAAVVTAKFRNVAERHGKVNIEFQIRVPHSMADKDWQLRLRPSLAVMGDVRDLEPVIVTGAGYRKSQLKGYQQYERFLRSIITDTTRLVDMHQLEMFLRRNIPEIYAFRYDSTEVSDDMFYSHYGISQRQSVEHYVKRLKVRINNRRKSHIDRAYAHYVKSPILTEGIRLDTVLADVAEDFVYDYVETIPASPGLRKASVTVCGDIRRDGRVICHVPEAGPLTFYISSVSNFVDDSRRYVDVVLERRVSANTTCRVEFAQGKSVVDDTLGSNGAEIARIKDNLRSLMENERFDIDSIVVTASSSPEGSYRSNRLLSQRRSAAIAEYFGAFMSEVRDSVREARGILIDDDGRETRYTQPEIGFAAYSVPENWRTLDTLVYTDGNLEERDKEEYRSLSGIKDPDRRERAMRAMPSYKDIRARLYPRTRTVSFEFCLHRRGMVKDTVHTTVPDTLYMSGVQAIKDRDYQRALSILRPYKDFNTAIALCALDYNYSAMEILSTLAPDAPTLYMRAIIHARLGEDDKAAQCYIDACGLDGSFIHRGNLDPEISQLIIQYQLNDFLER